MRGRGWRREAGLSLVELVVAMAVFTVLALVLGGVLSQGLSVSREVDLRLDAQDQARFALERMAREIRARKYFLPGELTEDRISFVTVPDPKASIPQRTVTYRLDPAARVIERLADWGREVVATDVVNDLVSHPLFSYYDGQGNEVTPASGRPSATRRVRIQIQIQPRGLRAPYTVATEVELRN